MATDIEKTRNIAIIGAVLSIILLYLFSSFDFSGMGGGGSDTGREIITPYESMSLGEIYFQKTQEYSQNLGDLQISPSAFDVMLYKNNQTQTVFKKSLFEGHGTNSISFNFLVQDYDAYFVNSSKNILLQFNIIKSTNNRPLIIKLNNKEIFNDILPQGLQVIKLDKNALHINNKIELTTTGNLWETTEYTIKDLKVFSHDYTQNLAIKLYKPYSNKFKVGKLKFDVISVKPNPPVKLEIKHNGIGIFNNEVAPVATYSSTLFTNIYADSSNTFSFYAPFPFKININNIRLIYWDGNFVTKELSFNMPKLKNEKQMKIVFFVNKSSTTPAYQPLYVDLTTRTGKTQKGTIVNPSLGPNYLYFNLPKDAAEGTAHLTFSTESHQPYNITKVQIYII